MRTKTRMSKKLHWLLLIAPSRSIILAAVFANLDMLELPMNGTSIKILLWFHKRKLPMLLF
jgi:hypothetical protein